MKHFLKDDLHDLYDPFLMKNMKEAVECIPPGEKGRAEGGHCYGF